MGHRQNRDAPTRPRRIHATDEKWSEIKIRAQDVGLSIAAFVVSRALGSADPATTREEFLKAQALTSANALLVEIADDIASAGNDVNAVAILAQLVNVAKSLDDGALCDGAMPSTEGLP